MSTYTGKVLNGFGELVGSGLEVDGSGVVVNILPVTETLPEGWITPGLIDIHNHGGGGASFPDDTTPEGTATAVEAHRCMGTTALVASTVSLIDPLPAIRNLVLACESGDLIGIHLEGPYISKHKCVAQNPAAIRNPDLDELRSWLEAGKGWIKTMTIAPEVENAYGAACMLLDHGALPSWGHTSGTSATARDLIERTTEYGRSIGIDVPQTATHLFNAMPTLAHREPGPVRELIKVATRGDAVVELVADTVHVNADLVGDVVAVIENSGQKAGVAWVTDAMAGAGMADGDYVLGSQAVTIEGGVARLTEGGAIAGGTSRLAEQIARMVGGGHTTMESAVRCCVAGPAHALGLDGSEAGVTLDFVVGQKANFVVFTEDLAMETFQRV